MRDIAGLLLIAFRQAHELSEAVLDQTALQQQRRLSDQLSDAAVSALAHVAAASANYGGDYFERLEAASSVGGARGSLVELKQLLTSAHGRGALSDAAHGELVTRCSDLTALLMAIAVEMRVSGRGRSAA